MKNVDLFFSDFFNVDPQALEDYGAYNISLKADLPLFIDPFLLFNSKKDEYKQLHQEIIRYLIFLRDKANSSNDKGFIRYYYTFPEVTQNWFGFSISNNRGRGLGSDFANNLNSSLYSLLTNFGSENITQSSHLEKLCLIRKGVGKDNISDFTSNLIKDYLLNYTENFANSNLDKEKCSNFRIAKVAFDYTTETWIDKTYFLPKFENDFVILTPKDLLTQYDIWINKSDMAKHFDGILIDSATDPELRAKLNNYLFKVLKDKGDSEKVAKEAKIQAYSEFPDLIDFYIRYKENHADEASELSKERVEDSEIFYINQFGELANKILSTYKSLHADTYEETKNRVAFMKDVIETKDGYKLLYDPSGNKISSEKDLQILFRFVWFGSVSDVNREPNNGRGPVDYKVSVGASDITLAEFKLASNSKLKQNLEHQIEIYKEANNTKKSLKVIFYFSAEELAKTKRILTDLNLTDDRDIILVDCRRDNKISASNVK